MPKFFQSMLPLGKQLFSYFNKKPGEKKDPHNDVSPYAVVAISYIITAGISFSTVVPVMLGALVDELAVSTHYIGFFTAINTLGIALASLAVSILLRRYSAYHIVRAGFLLLLAAEISEAVIKVPTFLMVLRFIAGFAGGLIYASGLSLFAQLQKPVRGFSTYSILFSLFSATLLQALPILIGQFGIRAGFLSLALVELSAVMLLPVLKQFRPKLPITGAEQKEIKAPIGAGAIFAVVAYFALQGGAVSVWSFLERLGNEREFSTVNISMMLASVQLGALTGATLIRSIMHRLTLLQCALLPFPTLITSLLMLYFAQSYVATFAACGIFAISWGIYFPFYQTVQALYDKKGRVVSLGAFMNMIGQSTGPAVATLFIADKTFAHVTWVGITMLSLSFVSLVIAVTGLQRQQLSGR